MKGKQPRKHVAYGILIFFILTGGAISYLLFFDSGGPGFVMQPVNVEQEVSPLEKKIERIKLSDEAYLMKRYGKIDTLFRNCDPGLERKAITERLACIRTVLKAEKFWRNMNTAEVEIKSLLLKGDTNTLSGFLSCDSYDLTWYEMQCEADRQQVREGNVKHLLDYIQKSGSKILQDAVWQQRTPDRRLYRNPRWILRSRLVSPDFMLIGPWKLEPHPTEKGTLIMLEQHLDGRIYIVGIPISGTYEE